MEHEVQYQYKAKSLSWSCGKPNGQYARCTENRQQNLSPPTRHENVPVSFQVPFQLRDFAF